MTLKPFIIGDAATERNATAPPYSLELPQSSFSMLSFRGVGYKDINEDRIFILPHCFLFSVIDGMGGPGEGAKAAQILTEELSQIRVPNREALLEIQKKVYQRIQNECSTPYSGVSYVVFWIGSHDLHIHHVGDVKAVLLDYKNQVKLETRDHTMLNAWVDQGYLSKEEAYYHPRRHIITKALTGKVISEPESQQIAFHAHDRMIVATDGLWDNFSVEEVIQMIDGLSPCNGVSHLMQQALLKMQQTDSEQWQGKLRPKPDNISILIGDFQQTR